MGENVDSDLLYEDFQNDNQKEFNNVRWKFYLAFLGGFLEK